MAKIEKINAISLGKTLGIFCAFAGLLIGLGTTIFLLTGSIINLAGSSIQGPMFGVWSIIILPIVYGILGFIFGTLIALAYNMTSIWTGGLEIKLD